MLKTCATTYKGLPTHFSQRKGNHLQLKRGLWRDHLKQSYLKKSLNITHLDTTLKFYNSFHLP